VKTQQFKIHPSTRIGYVSLNVPDIQRSLEFYQTILGFGVIGRPSGERALLSVDGSSFLVELLQVNKSSDRKRAGLYHFAILLPERKFLADMLLHLRENRDRVYLDGLADHLVSESIYIRDPDLNGIEIYRDRPSSEWHWGGNYVRMATERLDTEDLLKEASDTGWKEMPARTVVGHVHLHVRDIKKASKFYSETLGLNHTATYPGAYFFAAGRYHHHIATNAWLGRIPPASPGQAGLNHFGIELPSKEELEKTVEHLLQLDIKPYEQGTMSAFFYDNDGIMIRLYCSNHTT
jgi:catechol 2,3-dioxygenase